jgi:hypothetical protein
MKNLKKKQDFINELSNVNQMSMLYEKTQKINQRTQRINEKVNAKRHQKFILSFNSIQIREFRSDSKNLNKKNNWNSNLMLKEFDKKLPTINNAFLSHRNFFTEAFVGADRSYPRAEIKNYLPNSLVRITQMILIFFVLGFI